MPCLGIPRILLNRMKLFVQRVAPALPANIHCELWMGASKVPGTYVGEASPVRNLTFYCALFRMHVSCF